MLHWTLPTLGGFVAFLPLMAGSNVSGWLGFLYINFFTVLLVLAHEVGHALFARMFGAHVLGLVLSGHGGLCLVANEPSSRVGRAFFYAGGAIAQVIVLGLCVVGLLLFSAPTSLWATCAVFVLLGLNAVYLLFTLIPHGSNDGVRLLQLFRDPRHARSTR